MTMRVYRITVRAYNSRSTFPSAYFVYDVRAVDTVHASRLIPGTHRGPKDVLYSHGAMTGSGTWGGWSRDKVPAYYPEWEVERTELRRGKGGSQKRRPMVWLGKSPVVLVEQGLVTEYL